MILHGLEEYYRRRTAYAAANDEAPLAPAGREFKEIAFIIDIDMQGEPVLMTDTREGEGKKKRAARFCVPKAIKRTSGVAANLLWDTAEYTLGMVPEGKKPADSAKKHADFVRRVRALCEQLPEDEGLRALCAFLSGNPLEKIARFPESEELAALIGANITFRLDDFDDPELICNRPAVSAAIDKMAAAASEDASQGICLITGERGPVARLHPPIKGVAGAQSSGADIVSFNSRTFESYGKKNGDNSPVSIASAERYVTALNDLLGRDSARREIIGDVTVVWWAEKEADADAEELALVTLGRQDDPDKRSAVIKDILEKPAKGGHARKDDGNPGRFYILGLAPAAARISVRFFYVMTADAFAERVKRYFSDIELPSFHEKFFPPLYGLCSSLAHNGDYKLLPSNFRSEMFRCAVSGENYPRMFFTAALARAKAEREVRPNLAAIVKAYLIRNLKQEATMTLDVTNTDPGYLLGRLFAVQDKLKEEETDNRANRRDKFFASASTRPLKALVRLQQLAEIDLKKLRRSKSTRGLAVKREKQMQEILATLPKGTPVPASLTDTQQGWFVLGFYHQRDALFKPASKEDTAATEEQN